MDWRTNREPKTNTCNNQDKHRQIPPAGAEPRKLAAGSAYAYPDYYPYSFSYPYWFASPWFFGLGPTIFVAQRFPHFHRGFGPGFNHGFHRGFGRGFQRAGGMGGHHR